MTKLTEIDRKLNSILICKRKKRDSIVIYTIGELFLKEKRKLLKTVEIF